MSFTNLNAVAKPCLFFYRSPAAFWDTLFLQQRPVKQIHAIYMLLVGKGNMQHNMGTLTGAQCSQKRTLQFLSMFFGPSPWAVLSPLGCSAGWSSIQIMLKACSWESSACHPHSHLFLIG